jgi:hypothetical protein
MRVISANKYKNLIKYYSLLSVLYLISYIARISFTAYKKSLCNYYRIKIVSILILGMSGRFTLLLFDQANLSLCLSSINMKTRRKAERLARI